MSLATAAVAVASTQAQPLDAPTTSNTSAATGSYATVNYNGLIGFNATDPYAITAESRSGAFALSIGTQILMCLFYGILAFTAITSNMIVCYIVLSNSKMRTATNYFTVNLALGDILMAMLCIPFTFPANLIFQYWPFGLSLCIIVSYSQANSVFISAYTMVAISIDKYMAIMYPMRLRMPKTQAKLIILAIWSAALLTSLPTAFLSSLAPDSGSSFEEPTPTTNTSAKNQMVAISGAEQKEQREQQPQRKYFCQESWSFWPPGQYYYSMALMILQFVLPLFVLVITYSRIVIIVWGKRIPGEEDDARDARMARSKRKMIKMVMLCVIAFALTWLPFNALIVIGDIQPDIWEHQNIMLIWFVTHYLAMCHTITNPLIYIWMNNRFRQGFKEVIGDLCRQARRLLTFVWFHCCCCGCLLKGPRHRYLQQARQLRQQRALARLPQGGCGKPGGHQNQTHTHTTTQQTSNNNHVHRGHQQHQQQQRRMPDCCGCSTTGTGSGGGEQGPRQVATLVATSENHSSSAWASNVKSAAVAQHEPEQERMVGSGGENRSGSPENSRDAKLGGARCKSKSKSKGNKQSKEVEKANKRARRKRRQHSRPHQIQIQMVVRGDSTSGRKPETGAEAGKERGKSKGMGKGEARNSVVEMAPASDHSSCTNSPATNTTSLSLTLQHHHQHHQHLNNHQHNTSIGSKQPATSCSSRQRFRSMAGLESSGAGCTKAIHNSRVQAGDTVDLDGDDSRATDEDVCEQEAFNSRSRSQSQSHSQFLPAHSKSNNNVSSGGAYASSSQHQAKSNGSLELLSDGGQSSSNGEEEESEDEDDDVDEGQELDDDQDQDQDQVDEEDDLESEFNDEDDIDELDKHGGQWLVGGQVFEMATLEPRVRCKDPPAFGRGLSNGLRGPSLAKTSSMHVDDNVDDDNGRLRLLKRLFRSTQDDLFRRRELHTKCPGRSHHHHSNGLSHTSKSHRQDRSLRRAMLLNNHLLTCSLRRIPTTLGGSSGQLDGDSSAAFPHGQCRTLTTMTPGCTDTNQSSSANCSALAWGLALSPRQTGATSSLLEVSPQAVGELADEGPEPTVVSKLLGDRADSEEEEDDEDDIGDEDDDARTVVRRSPTVYLINNTNNTGG